MLYTYIVKNLPLKDKKFWTRGWLAQVVMNIIVFVTIPALLFEAFMQTYFHRGYDYSDLFRINCAIYGILILFFVTIGITGYFENKRDGWKTSLRISSMVSTYPLIILICGGFLFYGAYRFYPFIYGDIFEKTLYLIWIVFFVFVIGMALWIGKDGYRIYRKIETSENIKDLREKFFRIIKNNFPEAEIKENRITVGTVKIHIKSDGSEPKIVIKNLKKENLPAVANVMKVIDDFKMG